MNCTKILITRPGGPNGNQGLCYNEHKCRPCLLHLTVTAVDELILYVYRPSVGRRIDMTLYWQSGLDQKLQQKSPVSVTQHDVYGDPAFRTSPWIQIAFNRTVPTPRKDLFNTGMSGACKAVERSNEDIKQQFSSMNFARTVKASQAPIAVLYKMPFLLWNLKVSLHCSDEVDIYFQCEPPMLSEYLAPLQDI